MSISSRRLLQLHALRTLSGATDGNAALRVAAGGRDVVQGQPGEGGHAFLAASRLAEQPVRPQAAPQAGGWSGWSRTAAAAAAAALGGASLCEAPGTSGGCGSEGSIGEAVVSLWAELNEQLHRLEASLPPGHSLPSIPLPEVVVSGREAVVTFLVPQALDTGAGLQEVRRRMRAPPARQSEDATWGRAAAVTEESTFGSAGMAWHFRRHASGHGDGALAIDVQVPFKQEQPARFVFTAAGDPGDADLELMTAVLQSCMRLRRGAGWGLPAPGSGSLADHLDELGRLFPGAGQLLGGMSQAREMVIEMERSWGPLFEGFEEEEEEEEGEPGLSRRGEARRRFSGRPHAALEGQAGAGQQERHAGERGGEGRPQERQVLSPEEVKARREARLEAGLVAKLQSMGAQVFLPQAAGAVDWGVLAGYEEQKAAIQETVLDALTHPGVYDDIARGTRARFASNRPRAVLFEGPPGTGKTTSARVIATQASVPLVYVPLEAIMSKWYGESEQKLGEVLSAAEALPRGCLLFLDELDSLATSRGGDMHEATRRLLGVLLRHLDGFDSGKKTIVIGATNRKQDLDAALISRFSASIAFGLPDQACRLAILRQYARHLGEAELQAVAEATPGLAGRDLRDLAECAERKWASKLVRGEVEKGELPPVALYLDCARRRLWQVAGAL